MFGSAENKKTNSWIVILREMSLKTEKCLNKSKTVFSLASIDICTDL